MIPIYTRKALVHEVSELLEPYQHLELSVTGYRERITAAEVLLCAAAREVIHARVRYPNHTFSNEHYPLESITTVGAYVKALRTGAVDEFNARLDAIEDPEIRETHRLCTNARFAFVEPEEACAMRTTDEVLYHIRLVQSYD